MEPTWSHPEITALRELYPKHGGETPIRGKDRKQIYGMAHRLGLKFLGVRRKRRASTRRVRSSTRPGREVLALEKKAIKFYTTGLSTRQVGVLLNKSPTWVRNHLKRRGVELRSRIVARSQHYLMDELVTIRCPTLMVDHDGFIRSLVEKSDSYSFMDGQATLHLTRGDFSHLLHELNGGHLPEGLNIEYGGIPGA